MKVEFHTGLAQPLLHAARLLRKAVRQGGRVLVVTPQADALSQALWALEPAEFLPHARAGSPAALLRRSPVWLLPEWPLADTGVGPDEADAADAPRVWLNLDGDLAPERGCQRLIEIVGTEPPSLAQGRARWSAYKARGWDPQRVFDGG